MLRLSAESAGFLASVVGSGLAILSTDSDAAESSLREWLASCRLLHPRLSNSIPAASDVPLALRQAQWTTRVAQETAREVLSFDQLGFDRLLFPSADAPDLDVSGPLHKLRAEATALGFDPRETLEAFLDAGGNIRDAARDLHVHANTLRYRLARLEKSVISTSVTHAPASTCSSPSGRKPPGASCAIGDEPRCCLSRPGQGHPTDTAPVSTGQARSVARYRSAAR